LICLETSLIALEFVELVLKEAILFSVVGF